MFRAYPFADRHSLFAADGQSQAVVGFPHARVGSSREHDGAIRVASLIREGATVGPNHNSFEGATVRLWGRLFRRKKRKSS